MSTIDRTGQHIAIAGVPWPAYKLLALAVGVLTLLAVGVATSSAATAVLTAAAVCTVIWLTLGFRQP